MYIVQCVSVSVILSCCVTHSLRVSFRWLVRAFAGHLLVRELFALWDRVVVCDSLRPLALLAVAVFSFRRHNLLQVRTAAAAEVRSY